MALRGNLTELSLPDIFQLVTFSGKTGVLRIRRGDGAQGSVWFRDGDVFFALSNWHTDPLGERLVRAQRITPMALDRALELRADEPADGKRLGEILVEQGYITDKVLEAFVQEQMQDTIFDLMRWDEGDFEFDPMDEAPEEDIGLAVSIENVIMEGSRRLEEWNRIKKKIPSTDVVFKMATAPGEGTFEISLKPGEWNLLLLIDGSRSVAELALATNRTDFEVARIVYGLFSAGLLEFASEDEIKTARAERTEREAKFAEFEVEQAARRAAEEAASPKPSKSKGTSKKTAEVEAPSEPVEVPEFLETETQAASAEDLEALEAAMGALLSAPEAAPPAPEAPAAAPYTPGEEPAFIAASHEVEAQDSDAAMLAVEELLGDITDLTPAAEVVEPSAEAPVEPVADVAAEPGVVAEAPAVEFEVERPETFEPAIEMAAEQPAIEPEPTPVEAFEFVPVTAPPGESVEASVVEPPAPEARAEEPLEPGTFVVVPTVAPAGAEPEVEQDWEPPQISFDDETEIAAEVAEVPTLEELPERAAAVEPADETLADLPEVVPSGLEPTPPQPPPAASIPGLASFEHDLMSLGLGELPPELREPALSEDLADIEPVVEPMGVSAGTAPLPDAAALSAPADLEPDLIAEPAPVESAEPDTGADFSALLESLDISADDADVTVPPAVEAGAEPAFEPDPLLDLEPEAPSAGVISTDAFLDDLSLEGDFGFTGELTDELSALTGADRPTRPSASVHRIPDKGEATLHRDSRVDKETLLKIITGIEKL